VDVEEVGGAAEREGAEEMEREGFGVEAAEVEGSEGAEETAPAMVKEGSRQALDMET